MIQFESGLVLLWRCGRCLHSATVCECAYVNKCLSMHICICLCAYVFVYVHALYVHAHGACIPPLCAYVNTCLSMRMHTCIRTCLHICARTSAFLMYMCMHDAYVNTYPLFGACTPPLERVRERERERERERAYAYVRVCARGVCTCEYARVCICEKACYMHIRCMCMHMRACMCMHVRVCKCTCVVHAYPPASCMHTRTHAYTHTRTHANRAPSEPRTFQTA